MKRITVSYVVSCFAAATILACGGSDLPKTPLGSSASDTVGADAAAVPAIRGEAKVALDSGNVLFRQKSYDKALAQYRRSADLAPTELAPLLGIMMIADVTRDSRLADATLPRIRKLNPMVADSSAVTPHSRIVRAHPRADSTVPRR
jgi:hypothetical protein